jgi:hypothetical protein
MEQQAGLWEFLSLTVSQISQEQLPMQFHDIDATYARKQRVDLDAPGINRISTRPWDRLAWRDAPGCSTQSPQRLAE